MCIFVITFLALLMSGCGTLKTPQFRTNSYRSAGYKHVALNHKMKREPSGGIGASHVELLWPVARPDISQSFAPPTNRKHDGIDLRGRKNTPIKAAHSGVVVYAGRRYSGYGKMILINNGADISTLYAHLNKYAVKTGDRVQRGQVIGYMGRTGRATGVHLHFEVLKDKIPVDPMGILP